MTDAPGIFRQADIARLAGVSQSAVSRTFGGGRVAQATREKVLRAAREAGYEPDAIARSLVTGQSNLVAIVLGDIHNPFYPYLLEELTSRLTSAGRLVLLFTVPRGGRVDDILPQALSHRVSGIIVGSAELSSRVVDLCRDREVPLVLLNRYLPGSGASGVQSDNHGGGRLAAGHLISLGRRSFGFVGGLAGTSTNQERRRGFHDALTEAGHDLRFDMAGTYSYEWGFEAAGRVGAQERAVDALFCGNDIVAMGLLDGLRRHGRRVPDDVAVVGFDDIPSAAWPAYDLTTLRQPVEEMAGVTLGILEAAQNGSGGTTGRLDELPVTLVIRGSTAGG